MGDDSTGMITSCLGMGEFLAPVSCVLIKRNPLNYSQQHYAFFVKFRAASWIGLDIKDSVGTAPRYVVEQYHRL